MAIDIMSAVWKAAPYSGTRLLILLALADAASQEGYCWPSIRTIAQRGRCNERNARLHVGALVRDGWIERVGRTGQSNLYHVYTAPNGAATPVASDPPPLSPATPPPVASDTPPLSLATGRTINESSKNHQKNSLARDVSTTTPALPAPEARERAFDDTALRRDPLTLTLIACLGREPATRREWGQWRLAINDLRAAGATADDIPRAIRGYQSTYPRARLTPLALVNHWSEIRKGTPHDLAQLEIAQRASAADTAARRERERADAERQAHEEREVERFMLEHGYGARA